LDTFEAIHPKTTFYTKAIKPKEGKNTLRFHTIRANILTNNGTSPPTQKAEVASLIARKANRKVSKLPDHPKNYRYR